MNFFDKQQLVSAVHTAAHNGVVVALKMMKVGVPTAAPAAQRKAPFFTHLASSSPPKPAQHTAVAAPKPSEKTSVQPRRSTPQSLPANKFAHLMGLAPAPTRALAAAASAAAPSRPAAPAPAQYAAAAATLAMISGPLAPWVEKPSEADLTSARAVMRQQEAARADAAAQRRAQGAAMAAQIMAAGDYRGVVRPA